MALLRSCFQAGQRNGFLGFEQTFFQTSGSFAYLLQKLFTLSTVLVLSDLLKIVLVEYFSLLSCQLCSACQFYELVPTHGGRGLLADIGGFLAHAPRKTDKRTPKRQAAPADCLFTLKEKAQDLPPPLSPKSPCQVCEISSQSPA